MKGFQERMSVEKFFSLIDQSCALNPAEVVSVTQCYDRVLAKEVTAASNVPNFDRSAMDGYALKGEETFGADSYNPITFKVIGRVTPGCLFEGKIGAGEAVEIMTGAPLPAGADAVLMAEYTERVGDQMQALDGVTPGKHVGKLGEDIKKGEILFEAGRRVRPQDAAVIASVGVNTLPVVRRPTVDLLITGDELLKPGEMPQGVHIVDSNSVILRNCVARDGGLVLNIRHLPDQRQVIRQALMDSQADVICITGGTAVGTDDYAPILVDELGELLVHGISMRPASPTGFGLIKKKPVFLMPGNPVSCLSAYDFFVARALRILGGRKTAWNYRREKLELATKISSQTGRVDYVRVKIKENRASLLATSGASILSSTTRADGFIIVPEESEGHAEGELVDIWLYDQ